MSFLKPIRLFFLQNRIIVLSGLNYKLQTHQVEDLPTKYHLTPCVSMEWQYTFFPNHNLKLHTGAGIQYKKEHVEINTIYEKKYFLFFILPVTTSLSIKNWSLEVGLNMKYLMYEKHSSLYPIISNQEMNTHNWFSPFNRFSLHTGMDLLFRAGYTFKHANKYQIGIFPEIRWYAIDNFYEVFHKTPVNLPQNKYFYMFSGFSLSMAI
ncbi:MAG: hypothetical protein Kow0068_19130 [Marinilabiliales bacterium]